MVPGQFGDIVDVDIDSDGRILNWPRSVDLDEFIQEL